MSTTSIDRRLAMAIGGLAWIGSAAIASAQQRPNNATPAAPENRQDIKPMPADVTTHHSLELPGRTLQFNATAGAIRLEDDKNAPRADVAFIAFRLDGNEPAHRPVTFVFNGGPGFASAWLNAGCVGPWRIPMGGDATAPSASAEPLPNAETWLDFTDLVFIDPAGTGYSRVLTTNEEARRTLWSVDGDITYLAEVVRRWLDRYDRAVSPKYLLGESYGGFRVPRLARELAANQGTGVSGLMLVSPALDFNGGSLAFNPFFFVDRLPPMTAVARAAHGKVTRDQLADVEQYARTEFLVDLTYGERSPDAIARRSARVAAFTGLDAELVKRYHGLIDNSTFLHEIDRAQGRVGSIYDATITSLDPFPLATSSDYPDPVLEALKAPISSAMMAIYAMLKWKPEGEYHLQSNAAFRQWDWGKGFGRPQAVGWLDTALALDPHVNVLITHGMYDLVTPYFRTQLLLDQIQAPDVAKRIRLSVQPGGHMFYTNDDSRVAFRADAAVLFGRA
jgi:carboxypeptidase C (cathepsin A)